MWRKREAYFLICQWTPVGKPLANVNNAQGASLRNLDANDARSHCGVPCCFLLNHLVGHSLHLSIPYISVLLFLLSYVVFSPYLASLPIV